jgi:small conductance mechanosensitive channel
VSLRFRPYLFVILLICPLLAASPAWPESEAGKPESPKPLTETQVQANDAALERIEALRAEVADLGKQARATEGIRQTIYEKRLNDRWLELLSAATGFAKKIAEQMDAGYDVTAYLPDVEMLLDKLPGEVRRNIIQTELKLEDFPNAGMPASEQLAHDAKLRQITQERDRLYQTLLAALQLAEKFSVPTAVDRPALEEMLRLRAEGQSVYLELSIQGAESLRFQAASLPNDEELKNRLAVVQNRVRIVAKSLGETVRMMGALGMETARFRQQVVKATGEISSEALDTRVIGGLVTDWFRSATAWLKKTAPSFLVKALTFLLIFYAFVLLARLVRRLLTRALDSSRLRVSQLLKRVAVSTTQNVIMIIGILIALSQLGIAIGPMLAGLGIAGFILGFALQDTLSNFASGMMILLYRPFDVGDVVEAGGVFGKVSHMSLVNTTVLTFDNQTLVIPNNKIWGDVIKNVTAQKIRRVDMTFGISYSDDIPKAESILRDILTSHEKTLDDPEPVVKLHKLGESSVDFIVRPWVKRDDYWDVYWDVTREVKMRFDAEGVSIPFPQRDVHLHASAKADWIQQLGGRRKPGAFDAAPDQDTTAASPIESDTND